ncbi:hypothetical protein AB1Y20_021131 [Prymnesium parvum]|uniref:Biotin-protein ligase N-terminal domain-containing protein n=1 Tax=Prymnesium parvum TaxID=97485 RepID=A0AB34JLE6_PRYPA
MALKLAYLPDPRKLGVEAGYPPPALRDLLSAHPDLVLTTITPAQLLSGALDDSFALLCLPGGFAPNYASALGAEGARLIRSFVDRGGGYVGICAGAFYATTACLSLLDVRLLDPHRWARGSAACQIRFSPLGAAALGALGPPSLVTVRYANGPLLQPGGGAYTLAHFATEVAAPRLGGAAHFPPIMHGSPAVVLGRCGRGMVALVSPHIEDGADERARTPLCNLFRLCARASGYSQLLLRGGGLAALERRAREEEEGRTPRKRAGGADDEEPRRAAINVLPALSQWTDRFVEVDSGETVST